MWSMIRVSTSGAQAQQRALDVAANNLANAQTTGFKSQRADIVDLPPAEGTLTLAGLQGGVALELGQVGQGAALAATRPDHTPGPVLQTGRTLDVAITGEGFIPVTTADGLMPLGQNLLGATDAAGSPIVGDPGTEGLGTLAPASLEGSNGDTANELVKVLQAERAYQANLRALRTVDEMIQEANNMRR